MDDSDGFGKAPKVRRHQNQSRTPYARPTHVYENPTSHTPLLETDTQNGNERPSLISSVLSAARTPLRAAADLLITKVHSSCSTIS